MLNKFTLVWGTSPKEGDGEVIKPKGTFNTEKEALAAMVRDWTNHGDKVHYTRNWMQDPQTQVIDYGSHTFFYFIIHDYSSEVAAATKAD